MKEQLSRIYLDDYPVTLMGDEATPPLSRIVRAGGKHPDRVDVMLLRSPSDSKGKPVDPDEVIDRTAEPTRPIYLRSIAKDVKPIVTASPALGLPTRIPLPDADPVISQLGVDPTRNVTGDLAPAAFRSPSQIAAEESSTAMAKPTPDKSAESAKPPATEPLLPAKPTLKARKAESLAAAEAEAEERQEEDRDQEGTLQDEQEALDEANEDGP